LLDSANINASTPRQAGKARNRSEPDIKRRFQNINRERLGRVRGCLQPHQQVFLDLLPLLFHTNHPLMPGYVGRDTPYGVAEYSPSRVALSRAQSFAKSFSYEKRALKVLPIQALYLMGSSGTVAYSSHSDFDIWLCHGADIDDAGAQKLAQKAREISRWADTLGLEVHFFLMDPIRFRNGVRSDLSGEDCGSAQHYLLLDEFYRTSIMVAGRYPLWWMIPAYDEKRYQEISATLLDKRFLKKDVPITDDPIEALSDAYLNDSVSTSSKYEDEKEKGAYLVDQIRTLKAEGVIL